MSDEDDSYKTSLMGERVMKSKNIVIVAGWLCILTFLAGCSAVGTMSTEEDTTVKSLVPQDGKALVYFMRPSGFGTAVKMRVTMGSGDYLGATGGGRYIYSLLDPGNYTFRSKVENASLLHLYYLRGLHHRIRLNIRVQRTSDQNSTGFASLSHEK